jgi:hypothetical protein
VSCDYFQKSYGSNLISRRAHWQISGVALGRSWYSEAHEVFIMRWCSITVLAFVLCPSTACPDEALKDDPQGIAFFESKIRPVLVEHCHKCHSAAAGKTESGLVLDTRDGVRAGGDRGPAVVPGDVKASILLAAISHSDSDLQMPPKKERLADAVIADMRRWIEMGAPDPRTGAAASRPPTDIESGRRFWAYQKPIRHEPPVTKNPA